jgi:large subunit ribosomal protein L4e
MKIQILDIGGKKKSEMTTNLFEEPIREDIIFKVVEAEKLWHPNAPKFEAGMARSASGTLTKRRKVWKSDRGKGLSRLPRKIMWRRGTQFSWVGAIVPSTRGGRRAHPPKGSVNLKKINKKELIKALFSSLSYISSKKEIQKKYSSLSDKEIKMDLPIVIEEKFLTINTKETLASLKNILGDLYEVAIQKKTIRAGIGKLRGRKNKKNAGLLLVVGKNQKKKIKGIEVIKSDDLVVGDLATNGARLTMFTEEAIKELEKVKASSGSKAPEASKIAEDKSKEKKQ